MTSWLDRPIVLAAHRGRRLRLQRGTKAPKVHAAVAEATRDGLVNPYAKAVRPQLGGPIAPPDRVADRDRRACAPQTPNMAVLGDPVPGRSALDALRQQNEAQV
jgi:hypothetical protein